MLDVPVQAVGYALRQAKVPCAEEIAWMLRRKYVGEYVSRQFKSSTATEATKKKFRKFPLEYKTAHYCTYDGGKVIGGTGRDASCNMTLYGKNIKAKVGDFVRIRYLFPEVSCRFSNNIDNPMTPEFAQDYFQIYLYVNGVTASEKELANVYGYYKSDTGSCYMGGNISQESFGYTYYPILENHAFTVLKDGDNKIGFELSGTLLFEVDNIQINITSYRAGSGITFRDAIVTVKYGSYDDFTITVNEGRE